MADRLLDIANHLSQKKANDSVESFEAAKSPSVGMTNSSVIDGEIDPEKKPLRVSVIGGGNWGTTIAKVVSESALEYPTLFDINVRWWVHEEDIVYKGENHPAKISYILNNFHENVKYLPGVRLPDNLHATGNMFEAIEDCDILVFNVPHQFLGSIIDTHITPILKEKSQQLGREASFRGDVVARHCIAISCLKGFHINLDDPKDLKIQLLSDFIDEKLNIPTGSLSGANLASEVAKENFSETTISFPPRYVTDKDHVSVKCNSIAHPHDPKILKTLFHRPYFHVRVIDDVAGVSVAGALKNIVALACGFVKGLGWGDNAAAAIQRIGLQEITKFGIKYFPASKMETYYVESAGVADLITTCNGGRNVKVGKRYAEMYLEGNREINIGDLEKEVLNGQSAQGIITAEEVNQWLEFKNETQDFPLFSCVYKCLFEKADLTEIPSMLDTE
jgi:glycerol-3-phosphate dehydrogenase (NAD+)